MWFSSTAAVELQVPPSLRLAKVGDLYVHTLGNGSKQVWILDPTQSWVSIKLTHPHPYLPDYVLNLQANGEPSWVTHDTIRTYQGRIVKAARDAAKRNASAAQASFTVGGVSSSSARVHSN